MSNSEAWKLLEKAMDDLERDPDNVTSRKEIFEAFMLLNYSNHTKKVMSIMLKTLVRET